MSRSATGVRRFAAAVLTVLLVALITYQGPVAADDPAGFSIDDFAGHSMGPRELVGGAADQCDWTDRNNMIMGTDATGTNTMTIDLRVPDTRGCHYASIGVRWTALTSVDIQQNGADRIILKYRDVLPNTPSAVTFGLRLVDVNGREATVGGLSRNGGPSGDFLTIRYAPAYEGDVSYLDFHPAFDKSRVKSVTLLIAATQSNQNVSVTFEGIGANVGEPAYIGPSINRAAAYEFPANTTTTHTFTVTGFPAPDVTWTDKPSWMTITTSNTSGGRLITMTGNPGGTFADQSVQFHAVVANSLTADAGVRVVTPSPVTVVAGTASTVVGTAGPLVVGTVSATPAANAVTNASGLPAGTALSISGTNVVLNGTPATAGTYHLQATLGNEFRTANFTRDLVVGERPHITPPATQSVVRGEPITALTPTVTGYPAPTVSVTGLPDGLTAVGGVISGTPATISTSTVTMSATNDFGTDSQTFDIRVGDRPDVTIQAPLAALAGTPVSHDLPVTGSPTSVSSIGLPDGVALALGSGVVEVMGTPARPTSAAEASGTASITVTNEFGSHTRPLEWSVAAVPLITGPSSATTTVGAALAPTDITITGYPTPTVTVADLDGNGTLVPAGLTVDDSASGAVSISGAPTATGTETVRITATNGHGAPVTHDVTVTSHAAPAFTHASPSLTVGQGEQSSITLSATGFPAPTLSASSTLPVWLTFDPATGLLTARPSASIDGAFGPFAFEAHNTVGSATVNVSVDVTSPAGLTVTNAVVAQGTAANAALGVATGHPVPTVAASGLPAGLTLSQSGATVSLTGTPTAPGGDYTVSLTATNGTGAQVTRHTTVTVTSPPTITVPATDTFTAGFPASLMPAVGGFPAPTVTATGLPPGVTVNAVTGELTGFPSAIGHYAVTFTTVGGAPGSSPATASVAITVASPPTFGDAPTDQTVLVGTPTVLPGTTAGFPEPTVGAVGLPPGITVQSLIKGFVISGSPTQSGVFPVMLTVTNGAGTAVHYFTITVTEPPSVSAPTPAPLVLNQPIAPIPVTLGGYPVPMLTATGLPAGLAVVSDAQGVRIEGTPTQSGDFAVILTATNNAGMGTGLTVLTMSVGEPPVLGDDVTFDFPAGTLSGHPITSPGTGPTTVTPSALPSWLVFDSGTYAFVGAPLVGDVGTSGTVTVTATNPFGIDTQTVTYRVTEAPAATPSSGTVTVSAGAPVSHSLASVRGFPTPTVVATGLPDGLSLSVMNGELTLSGATTHAGEHQVAATLSNGVGSPVATSWTVRVQHAAAITPPPDQTLTVGAPVSLPVDIAGYPAPTVTVTGLPAGLTWTPSASGGVIEGTPSAVGTSTVQVEAANGVGTAAQAQFILTTELATIAVTTGAPDVPVGSQVSISADGFQPGEHVSIELHSTPVLLATVSANSLGQVHTTVMIPTTTTLGAHSLVLTGSTGATGAAPVRVVARAALGDTGTSVTPHVGLAAVLVVAGAALVLVRRRSKMRP